MGVTPLLLVSASYAVYYKEIKKLSTNGA